MTSPIAAGQRASYVSVLAVREYRVLLTGMLMFALGFEFEILALSVLVYARTSSSMWAALAFSAGFAPQAIAGALFTSLADRLPPRMVISVSLVARALPGLAIGMAPTMPVSLMLAMVAAAALVTPVFFGANSGLLLEILSDDHYILGRSLLSLASSSTQILGLGLGGALLAVLSARWLMFFAGACLALAGVVTRLGLRRRPSRARSAGRDNPNRPSRAARGTVRATLAGNRDLLGSPTLRRLLLMQWLPVWFATSAEALAVPYTESLGHPAGAASFLLAAAPCGMLLGNLVVGRLCIPALRERLVFPLSLLVGVPLLAFLWRPPLVVASLLLFATGIGFAYSLGLQRIFADSIPARLRGQGFALVSTGVMGGQGLLPSAFGGLATVLGVSGAVAAAGVAVVVGALMTGWRLPDVPACAG